MWLNGQVISPVPDQSPSHRHRRADRAEAPDPAAADSEPLPPFAPAPVPGLVGPIRRKVGFELELGLDLAKGRVLSAPTTSAKSKQPSKEYASSGRPLRAETDWLLESSEEDEPQSGMQRSKDQTITKGETIRSGAGWRLTPDGGDGNWYPEFITDPVDEDKQPDRLPQIMQQLGTTVTKEWSDLRPGQYLDQGRGFVIGWAPQQRRKGLAANIHITVGVRPDRLIDLMGTLVQLAGGTKGKKKKLQPSLDENADDGAPSLAIDRSTLQILDRAVQQGQSAPGDPVYQGLVALMGTYVAGELRILDRLDDVASQGNPPVVIKQLMTQLCRLRTTEPENAAIEEMLLAHWGTLLTNTAVTTSAIGGFLQAMTSRFVTIAPFLDAWASRLEEPEARAHLAAYAGELEAERGAAYYGWTDAPFAELSAWLDAHVA